MTTPKGKRNRETTTPPAKNSGHGDISRETSPRKSRNTKNNSKDNDSKKKKDGFHAKMTALSARNKKVCIMYCLYHLSDTSAY